MNDALDLSLMVVFGFVAVATRLAKWICVAYLAIRGIVWTISSAYYGKIADMSTLYPWVAAFVAILAVCYVLDGLAHDMKMIEENVRLTAERESAESFNG
jgi:hypothetical protein